MTVARPETPPAAILFGMRNESRPHAVSRMPERHPRVVADRSAAQDAPALATLRSGVIGGLAVRVPRPRAARVEPGPRPLREQEVEHARRVAVHEASSAKPKLSAASSAASKRRRAARSARRSRSRPGRPPRAPPPRTRSRARGARARARRREAVVVELEDDAVRDRCRDHASRSSGNSCSLPGCVIMST